MTHDETIRDIHKRLGSIEKDMKLVVQNTEGVKSLRWHVRTLWVAFLGIIGVKGLS